MKIIWLEKGAIRNGSKLLKGKTKKYIVNLWFKDYDSVEEAIKDQCFFWEEQDKYVNEINKMLHILLKLGLK